MQNPLKLQNIVNQVAIIGAYLSPQQHDTLRLESIHTFTVNKDAIVLMAEITPAEGYVKAINLTFNHFYLELNFTQQGLDEFARIAQEIGLDSDSTLERFDRISINIG